MIKLNDPVEWIRMPWIRPEDIRVYLAEGICHFKLRDRLATTDALLLIARCYMAGKSPEDLFPLMERKGAKFRLLNAADKLATQPIVVRACHIPDQFIEHFRLGECVSQNRDCEVCKRVANRAVIMQQTRAGLELADQVMQLVPIAVRQRTATESSQASAGSV
ncbi:MAG: hypothetical protein HY674_16095 [Chloroflexi bacterium]|nr:hypothetical protein [Chloroflexota bacterium]